MPAHKTVWALFCPMKHVKLWDEDEFLWKKHRRYDNIYSIIWLRFVVFEWGHTNE